MAEIERLALDLPEEERGALAARLLESLPPFLEDKDEGLSEAGMRDAELDRDPAVGMTLEELDRKVKQRQSRCA